MLRFFGKTFINDKKLKSLNRENLRDPMDDLELIFTMFGEASTTKIAKSKNPKGFHENKITAIQGRKIAGRARKELEENAGESVLSDETFLDMPEKLKKKNKKLILEAVQ